MKQAELDRVSVAMADVIASKSSKPQVCLTTARRAAEVVCNEILRQERSAEKETKDNGLERLIVQVSHLRQNGKRVVPRTVETALKVLQLYGNIGAHDTAVDDPNDIAGESEASGAVAALQSVVDWYSMKYGTTALEVAPSTCDPSAGDSSRALADEYPPFEALRSDIVATSKSGRGSRPWLQAHVALARHVAARLVERELNQPATRMDLRDLVGRLNVYAPGSIPKDTVRDLQTISDNTRAALSLAPQQPLDWKITRRVDRAGKDLSVWFKNDYIKHSFRISIWQIIFVAGCVSILVYLWIRPK
ncbi:MAG: hypothetical protein NVS3B20_12770 [Polyangiales bacterium]